ncbi:biotin transporter BioY [Candidatus Omnitrophota bacterium]
MRELAFDKELITSKAMRRAVGISVFVLLTCFGAFLKIPLPFSPVPITLQTFFVLLSGAFLGGFGLLSQASYILLGVFGLPIFAGAGSGIFYLFGPTGGYLFGFLLAALLISRLIKYSGNHFLRIFVVFCLGDLVLLSCGVIWLRVLLGYPLKKLLLIGFIPFIPGELLKIFAAAIIYLRLKTRLKEIF